MRIVRRYVKLAEHMRASVGHYVRDVKDQAFLGKDESY